MWSINSVTATMHEVTEKNSLLQVTDIRYYLQIYSHSLLYPSIVLEESPRPRGSSRSPCPYPQTLSH